MSRSVVRTSLIQYPERRARVTDAMLAGVERDVVLAYRIGGMHAALGTLNARTRFRVTALCPLSPGPLARVSVYDRDDPRGQFDASLREVCSVARVIADDFDAARVADDVDAADPGARGRSDAFASRAGARVFTATGVVWGVLLHYDLRLRMAAPEERMILDHLGRRFSLLFPRETGAIS